MNDFNEAIKMGEISRNMSMSINGFNQGCSLTELCSFLKVLLV